MRAPFSQTQDQVDDTELWAIAVAFGIGEEDGAAPGQENEDQFHRSAEEFNRQRVLHAQGLGPPPTVPSPAEAVPDAMLEAFLRQKAERERAASGGDPR